MKAGDSRREGKALSQMPNMWNTWVKRFHNQCGAALHFLSISRSAPNTKVKAWQVNPTILEWNTLRTVKSRSIHVFLGHLDPPPGRRSTVEVSPLAIGADLGPITQAATL